MKITFVTGNAKKLEEVKAILTEFEEDETLIKGFLIDDLSKADIEDENDELFLISVLQHGIAKQIAGVEFYDILISKIADKFIDWAENADAGMYDIGGNGRRRSRSRSRSIISS